MSTPKSSLNPGRSSPFRRPASPLSHTPASGAGAGRSTTPSSNRTAPSRMTSPAKHKQSYTISEEEEDNDEEEVDVVTTPTRSNNTNSFDSIPKARAHTEPPPSPTTYRRQPAVKQPEAMPLTQLQPAPLRTNNSRVTSLSQNDNLSKLSPQLLHSMRESFSVLDSDSNGYINAASVSETFHSLGIQESNISQFFPPGQSSQLSLPQYLNQLANVLVNLSPQQELLNAFSAFDDDDSGQIDVAELRHALLNTAPDPGERTLTDRDIDSALKGYTGRRILPKNAIGIAGVRGLNGPAQKKTGGDVFRYQEFVGNLMGGPAQDSVSTLSGVGPNHISQPIVTGKAFP